MPFVFTTFGGDSVVMVLLMCDVFVGLSSGSAPLAPPIRRFSRTPCDALNTGGFPRQSSSRPPRLIEVVAA